MNGIINNKDLLLVGPVYSIVTDLFKSLIFKDMHWSTGNKLRLPHALKIAQEKRQGVGGGVK